MACPPRLPRIIPRTAKHKKKNTSTISGRHGLHQPSAVSDCSRQLESPPLVCSFPSPQSHQVVPRRKAHHGVFRAKVNTRLMNSRRKDGSGNRGRPVWCEGSGLNVASGGGIGGSRTGSYDRSESRMREIRTPDSMSGDGKWSVAAWPKLPHPSSALPQETVGLATGGSAY
jgi:hypothetical protein